MSPGILWLQGLPDQAIRAAEKAVEDAQATDHPPSLCHALALGACPITLLTGDLTAAERHVHMLADRSARYAIARWGAQGRAHRGVLLVKQGDDTAGLALVRAGLVEAGPAGLVVGLMTFLTLSTEPLRRAGPLARQLQAVREAIDRSVGMEEHWARAELLRIEGELLLLVDAPGAARAAEDHFRQALDWAQRQGALSWGTARRYELGCCAIRVVSPTRGDCSYRSITGSPKDLGPLISSRQSSSWMSLRKVTIGVCRGGPCMLGIRLTASTPEI